MRATIIEHGEERLTVVMEEKTRPKNKRLVIENHISVETPNGAEIVITGRKGMTVEEVMRVGIALAEMAYRKSRGIIAEPTDGNIRSLVHSWERGRDMLQN